MLSSQETRVAVVGLLAVLTGAVVAGALRPAATEVVVVQPVPTPAQSAPLVLQPLIYRWGWTWPEPVWAWTSPEPVFVSSKDAGIAETINATTAVLTRLLIGPFS
jgi:hypothetical protein